MNILVTGASGFIASHIITELMAAGHQLTCCARNVSYIKSLFPNTKILSCDFIKDTSPSVWLPRLKKIEVVINCVGILYHPNKKVIWAVHDETPRALFDACVTVGVQKIIQISALGVDENRVEYATSKKAADAYLMTLPITAVILRPSLVYGQGSYGGSSLFRGLAGLPLMIPVPGSGKQLFQPIHVRDLSKAVKRLIESPLKKSIILHAVSAKKVSLTKVLETLRSWLGFSKASVFSVPLLMIRIGSWFGDLIPYSAMNTSSYKMLMKNNITTEEEVEKFQQRIGFMPREFSVGVYSQPSSVQDHWHAQLYFLKPLLQVSIAFVWLYTAVCVTFLYPKEASLALLAQVGVSSFWGPIVLYASCALDFLLGIAMLFHYHIKKICLLQILMIVGYSAIISWKLPQLWLDPFGPIIKNIPLITAILVYLAIEVDR